MRAVMVEKYGGPDVLTIKEVDPPRPDPGAVLVDNVACGVNFVDVYRRSGLYDVPLPFIAGLEGAGRITAVGDGVTDLEEGDLIGWVSAPGSYAEQVVVPVEQAFPLPATVAPETAAAVLLQGMTAHYLTHSTYPVKRGDTVLIHAAAGGMGLLLCQLAKLRGARVIGTVSTDEKAAIARQAGADEIIKYTEADFVDEVRRLTDGDGVPVVYDGVGQATFDGSLASLAMRGFLVLYGEASGPVPAFDPRRLNTGGFFLTRPSLAHYTLTREERLARAEQVLSWVANGRLTVRIGDRYPLDDARSAHEDLEARRTTGKLLLVP